MQTNIFIQWTGPVQKIFSTEFHGNLSYSICEWTKATCPFPAVCLHRKVSFRKAAARVSFGNGAFPNVSTVTRSWAQCLYDVTAVLDNFFCHFALQACTRVLAKTVYQGHVNCVTAVELWMPVLVRRRSAGASFRNAQLLHC
jgi:hypothetical protein